MKPKIKLDAKDMKILRELDKDARQPFSIIAKNTDLSKQVVKYRVDRMVEKGVITEFLSFIDVISMGYTFHNIGVKLKSMYLEKHGPIIEELKKIPNVAWLVSCEGKYTFFICVLAKDTKEFNQVLHQVLEHIGNKILSYDLSIVIDAVQLPYRIFENKEIDHDKHHVKLGKIDPSSLKTSELFILQELASNARVTNLELSQKLNCEPSSITYRLDKLSQSGLIQGYKPLIDMEKLGYEWVIVFLQTKYVDDKYKKEFIEYLKTLPQTFFVVSCVGNWMMHLEFYLKPDEDMEQIMSKIMKKYDKIVKDYHKLTIKREHKCIFFPTKITQEEAQMSLDVWVRKNGKQTKLKAKPKAIEVRV